MSLSADKSEAHEIITGLVCRNCGSETDVHILATSIFYEWEEIFSGCFVGCCCCFICDC